MSSIVAQNEWSCALACVISLANDHGIQATQQQVALTFSSSFPEWASRSGLLTRIEILRLCELLGLPLGYVLVTSDLSEFLAAFSKRYSRWVGAFVLVHHPTHHCLRLFSVSGEAGELLDPGQHSSSRGVVRWSELEQRHPEFILICQ